MPLPIVPIYNEKVLLLESAEGKESAFAELFHMHRNKLYAFLMKLTGSPEQAEDIIQDIFMKLWLQRGQLPEIEHLSSYLFRMAQNQVLNSIKRMAKEVLILAELKKAIPDTSAQDGLELSEVNKHLQAAIEQLPERQKMIFRLSREAGLKHEEIAAQLHLSPHTVRNHMVMALKTLRDQRSPFLQTTAGATCILSIIESFQK